MAATPIKISLVVPKSVFEPVVVIGGQFTHGLVHRTDSVLLVVQVVVDHCRSPWEIRWRD
jgi:hypothetical protein